MKTYRRKKYSDTAENFSGVPIPPRNLDQSGLRQSSEDSLHDMAKTFLTARREIEKREGTPFTLKREKRSKYPAQYVTGARMIFAPIIHVNPRQEDEILDAVNEVLE